MFGILAEIPFCEAGCSASSRFVAGTIVVAICGGWCLWAGIYSLYRRACHGELKSYVSFGISVCFLFFFFGLWRSFYAWENIRGVWTDEERECHAILLNTPQISSRTVGAEAMLMAGDDGSSVRQTGKLWLTFSRDSLAETLRTGDELVFKGHIRRPKNKGNPEEFDYAEYLAVKGISGRVFIGKERWKRIHGYEDKERHLSLGVDLRIKALLWRDRILEVYRNTGLQVNPAKRNVLDLKNETCKSREKRNVLKNSHTRPFKTTKKQSKTGCFYSF